MSMSSSDPSQRPSSWPVRRERQQLAAARCMDKIISRLDAIDDRLACIQSQSVKLPPGLHQTYLADMKERIQRLETLYVCQTNTEVDDVIEAMLQRKSAKAASGSTSSTAETPDHDNEAASSSSNTLFFDISSVCHAASQTDRPLEQVRSTADAAEVAELQQLVGEWTAIDELQVNDIIKVRSFFTDATVGVQVHLAQDALGKVLRIDSEGDAEIRFPNFVALYPQERTRWILKTNVVNL